MKGASTIPHSNSETIPERRNASERARCGICPHHCALLDGQLGLCGARRATDGIVMDENYGRLTAVNLDPIEKKPLARFHPGANILSIGSYGCNLRCPFCQNADIACATERDVAWRFRTPEQVVEAALSLRPQGNIGIAYTYNEPLVGYEFVRDTAALVHEAALLNVIVSNGVIDPEPLHGILDLIDAANIDLKGFTEDFYRLVGGDLATVKATIEALARTSTCHLEVTTLVIPGLNDSPEEVDAAATWLASLDPDIPYHLTRFFPNHRMQDRPPTNITVLHELAAVARQHLNHVHLGNC